MSYSFLYSLFKRYILKYPKTTLFILSLLVIFMGIETRHFTVDASSDTLIIQDDPDYKLSLDVQQHYQLKDILIVTYHPYQSPLFSNRTFDTVNRLKSDIEAIPDIDSVISYLDVPLLLSRTRQQECNFACQMQMMQGYGTAPILVMISSI